MTGRTGRSGGTSRTSPEVLNELNAPAKGLRNRRNTPAFGHPSFERGECYGRIPLHLRRGAERSKAVKFPFMNEGVASRSDDGVVEKEQCEIQRKAAKIAIQPEIERARP